MRVYLDYNATAPLHPAALTAMTPYFSEFPGNPSSSHEPGRKAKDAREDARLSVSSSFRCLPEEVIFSSCGTESNNMAVLGLLKRLFPGKTPPVATSLIEHSSVLTVFKRLEREGAKVIWLSPARDGAVPPEEAERAFKEGAKLLSVMLANNETGVVQPIPEIAALAKRAGAMLHCDAVQAYGKIPLDVDALGVDMLSISGHKAYAPKGVGALYLRKGVLLEPLMTGGGHEKGLRPGTENIPSIVALGRMAELIDQDLDAFATKERAFRDLLETKLLESVQDMEINGAKAARIPNTTSVGFKGVEAAALAAELDRNGVYVSTASACSSGAPSQTLKAMGVPPHYALGTIRVSNGVFNTEEEILFAAGKIVEAVRKLRG